MSTSSEHICRWCGTERARLLHCAQCRGVVYCGRRCQRAHWPTHRGTCRSGSRLRPAVAAVSRGHALATVTGSHEAAMDLRSGMGNTEMWFTVSNETSGALRLFWLDHDADLKLYVTLRPGTHHRQHTYVGHKWIIKDRYGSGIIIFEARPQLAVSVVDTNRPVLL